MRRVQTPTVVGLSVALLASVAFYDFAHALSAEICAQGSSATGDVKFEVPSCTGNRNSVNIEIVQDEARTTTTLAD